MGPWLSVRLREVFAYRRCPLVACEQALSHFRCYKRCGQSGEAASYDSFLVPDLSPARCARRLVTRGFAARATSFITTKMRACSQAIPLVEVLLYLLNCSMVLIRREKETMSRTNVVRSSAKITSLTSFSSNLIPLIWLLFRIFIANNSRAIIKR